MATSGDNAGSRLAGEPVTLINVFEVPAEHADEFLVQWNAQATILSAQPGFVDATLHQAAAPDARFQFVNVAHWKSAGQFKAATANPDFQALAKAPARAQAVTAHPALYRVAATIGEAP